MHSQYYICDLNVITDHQTLFGEATYMPIDPSHEGAFLPDEKCVVCALPSHPEEIAALPGVIALPDPLRNKPVPVEVSSALAGYGVKLNATTFDVIDILTERSKGFAFVIK